MVYHRVSIKWKWNEQLYLSFRAIMCLSFASPIPPRCFVQNSTISPCLEPPPDSSKSGHFLTNSVRLVSFHNDICYKLLIELKLWNCIRFECQNLILGWHEVLFFFKTVKNRQRFFSTQFSMLRYILKRNISFLGL